MTDKNSGGETSDLPDELAVWLDAPEAHRDDARQINDMVRAVLLVNQTREQLELTTEDAVRNLDLYMAQRKDQGFGKFAVNLPSGYRVVDIETGEVIENETKRFVATDVRWAGRHGVEFINEENKTRVELSSLDIIIEPNTTK